MSFFNGLFSQSKSYALATASSQVKLNRLDGYHFPGNSGSKVFKANDAGQGTSAIDPDGNVTGFYAGNDLHFSPCNSAIF